MASSSKSPSAHYREDLSPLEIMAEEGVHNESERIQSLQLPSADEYVEWNKNYVEWRQQMLGAIKNEGLLGFIDGTVKAPPKTVITSVNAPNGGNTIHEEYVAWKRSDDLVREMILKRLTVYFTDMTSASSKETAKELWEDIARSEQRIRTTHYLPLYKAAITGDWETADRIIQKEEDAVRARITIDLETALIVAIKMVGGKNFEKLVEKMSPDDLAICDGGGRTALHWAAGFGNIEVAKLLVEKNSNLPNMLTHSKETPLFYAAEHGDRKMVEWLMELTDSKLLKETGFKIVSRLTHSQLYDIALTLLQEYPWLAYPDDPKKEEDLKFHALTTLAGMPSSFKSGNNFNLLQKLIYSSMKCLTKKNDGRESEYNHSRSNIEAPPASNNGGVANGLYQLKPSNKEKFLPIEVTFALDCLVMGLPQLSESEDGSSNLVSYNSTTEYGDTGSFKQLILSPFDVHLSGSSRPGLILRDDET